MADFDPSIAADVVAACQAGAAEISAGIGRTIDAPVEVTVGEAAKFDAAAMPAGFDGPGLLVVLSVGASAALFALPEAGDLLPVWYRDPDPSGTSKLTTLAQELGMLVLPEAFMPEDFKAAHVPSLAKAFEQCAVAAGAALVPLALNSGGKQATASLVWPAAQAGNAFTFADEAPKESAEPAITVGPAPAAAKKPAAPAGHTPSAPPKPAPAPAAKPAEPRRARTAARVENLPIYTRSLLHIEVPVTVTLAAKKQPVGKIVELAPGSIIQFDKSCEEMLDLEVGGQVVGQGEAVKVGDKFGIRLTSLIMPLERFQPVRPR